MHQPFFYQIHSYHKTLLFRQWQKFHSKSIFTYHVRVITSNTSHPKNHQHHWGVMAFEFLFFISFLNNLFGTCLKAMGSYFIFFLWEVAFYLMTTCISSKYDIPSQLRYCNIEHLSTMSLVRSIIVIELVEDSKCVYTKYDFTHERKNTPISFAWFNFLIFGALQFHVGNVYLWASFFF